MLRIVLFRFSGKLFQRFFRSCQNVFVNFILDQFPNGRSLFLVTNLADLTEYTTTEIAIRS